MKSRLLCTALAVLALGGIVIGFSVGASARDVVLPAGTLLQCTLNEPNFSSATAEVGDPVLCHLRGMTEFGQQAFPRGSYLVGHLESAKDPGHFWGKGYMKLQFDRIGLPSGDLPLDAKVIATRSYKVDKQGKIDGKGHAKRDIVEWMLPPLWPWKVIMLPARGPHPQLKGETALSLRLMDDVQIPQVAQTFGPGWHFFGHPENQSLSGPAYDASAPRLVARDVVSTGQTATETPRASYATYMKPVAAPALNVPSNVPVFVMKTGTVLTLGDYSYQDGRITYILVGGGGGVISSDEVDWTATTRVNAQRGVRITLRGGHTPAATPGL